MDKDITLEKHTICMEHGFVLIRQWSLRGILQAYEFEGGYEIRLIKNSINKLPKYIIRLSTDDKGIERIVPLARTLVKIDKLLETKELKDTEFEFNNSYSDQEYDRNGLKALPKTHDGVQVNVRGRCMYGKEETKVKS